MPTSVRIIIFNDTRFFFDYFGSGAGAGHGRAQENIDDQHDEEKNTKSYAQPQKPTGVNAPSIVAQFLH